MEQYKIDFVELLVKAGALKFGQFTLKSGRVAPYFLNVGNFYTGDLVSSLGKFYAEAFISSGVEADVIFGPAYKGIPLSVVTVSKLYSDFKKNLAFCFNRKEAKDHGEGNLLVGAPLNEDTKVLLIDDVMTAGTAVRETLEILKANGNPKITGILIAMNRMEKNNEGVNAVEEVSKLAQAPVFSIITLDDVIEILHNREIEGEIYIDDVRLEEIEKYRLEYGV